MLDKTLFRPSAHSTDRETVGIVLAGGSAYGAYEVGVMKALFQGEASICNGCPLDAQLFAATSVGSVNAAGVVAHAETGLARAVTTLEKMWREEIAEAPGKCGNGIYRLRGVPPVTNLYCLKDPLGLLTDTLDDGIHFLRETLLTGKRFLDSNDSLARRALELLDFSALLDTKPFANMLAATIPLEAIERSPKLLKVTATNFNSGKIRVFENKEIATTVGYDAILASAAIPGFFPPVEIDNELFVDGQTLTEAPILEALGVANTLHVIYMDPDVATIPIKTLRSTIQVLDRLFVIKWAFSINQQIEVVADFNRSYRFLNERHTLPPNDDPMFDELLRAADAVSAALGKGERSAQTTIHRYHPTEDLGSLTGFLDLKAERIDALIERGYRDSIAHDCEKSRCILPS
jgi:NTE family protein